MIRRLFELTVPDKLIRRLESKKVHRTCFLRLLISLSARLVFYRAQNIAQNAETTEAIRRRSTGNLVLAIFGDDVEVAPVGPARDDAPVVSGMVNSDSVNVDLFEGTWK